MNAHSTFRDGVESRDLDKMMSVFTDEAVLYNPFYLSPFEGKEIIRLLLANAAEVFTDFTYGDELTSQDGSLGLVFDAKVGDLHIHGIHLLSFDDLDRVVEMTVMVRPEKAAAELERQMTERMAQALVVAGQS